MEWVMYLSEIEKKKEWDPTEWVQTGWIGVDLDGTLAYMPPRAGQRIGDPIMPMVARVKEWIAKGQEVRIFTARVSCGTEEQIKRMTQIIQDWTERYIGKRLPVTCSKDYGMIECWDDLAVRVERNTGQVAGDIV